MNEQAIHKRKNACRLILCRRLLFWTDISEDSSKIESSKLDGTDRKRIVWTDGVSLPLALTSDHDAQTIYWVDRTTATVRTCKYDGSNQNIIHREDFSTGIQLRGIVVFQVYNTIAHNHTSMSILSGFAKAKNKNFSDIT